MLKLNAVVAISVATLAMPIASDAGPLNNYFERRCLRQMTPQMQSQIAEVRALISEMQQLLNQPSQVVPSLRNGELLVHELRRRGLLERSREVIVQGGRFAIELLKAYNDRSVSSTSAESAVSGWTSLTNFLSESRVRNLALALATWDPATAPDLIIKKFATGRMTCPTAIMEVKVQLEGIRNQLANLRAPGAGGSRPPAPPAEPSGDAVR